MKMEKRSLTEENKDKMSDNEKKLLELIQLEKMLELWDNEEDEFWDMV
ncbi:MAG: hypothetical protein ACTSRP_28390 [Candidatus Helarchaeota archaeon]